MRLAKVRVAKRLPLASVEITQLRNTDDEAQYQKRHARD